MKSKYFLIILIATVITIIVWAVADIAHSRDQNKTLPDTQELLTPIDTNFDQQVLDEL